MTTAQQVMNDFMNKLKSGYFDKLNEEETKYIADLVNALYHKDMSKTKIDLEMFDFEEEDPIKGFKRIPAGSWVYMSEDDNCIMLFDESKKFCCYVHSYKDLEEILYE